MLKKVSRLRKNNFIKISRLKKLAEWTQINPTDPETIQQLTDAMTYNYPVQINYEGSGWRNIQPYGWNTSKDGNILLMCYKDTGEVRSYRMDKIEDIFIDMDSTGPAITNNPEMNQADDLDVLVENLNGDSNITFNIEDNYPDDMPPIPGSEQQDLEIEQGVYDKELELLEDNNVFEEQVIFDDNNSVDFVDYNDNNQPNEENNVNMEGENENDKNQI